MGLLFVFSGILGVIVGLTGYVLPTVRQVEALIPDHNASGPATG